MTFHPTVLSARQKKVLRHLASIMASRHFYLGGGTAVALYLRHRRSQDFDWFTNDRLSDPLKLAQDLRDQEIAFQAKQTDRGTLHGTVAGVRLSFLEYRYPLLQPAVNWKEYGCPLASLDDLICMKLSAIAQRGAKKDFLDVYALGRKHKSIKEMLSLYQKKYAVGDIGHILYGLSYFDDADRERTPAMLWDVDWRTIKRTIRKWVEEVAGLASFSG